MSQYKRVSGKFKFTGGGELDMEVGKTEFDRIVKTLSEFYSGKSVEKSGPIEANASGEQALMVKDAKAEDPDPTELPFTVMLSFEERPAPRMVSKAKTALAALLSRLVDIAKVIPGPYQAGAILLDALEQLFLSESRPPEAVALAELDKDKKLDWRLVQQFLSRDVHGKYQALQPTTLNGDLWREFLQKIHQRTAGQAPGGVLPAPGAPAPAPAAPGAPAPAPAAPGAPAPAPAAPTAPEAPEAPAPPLNFTTTQLMGWLRKEGGLSYGFEIGGMTHFADDSVEYGKWARLDLFGPDGSQLLTSYLDQDTQAAWLDGEGAEDVVAKVVPTRELRAALTRQAGKHQEVATVSGRFWFSDGRPFGARTLAVYVKPALSHLIDECAPPEELDFSGGRGGAARPVPILQIPQALAVTQTDQGGYFEFSYTGDTPLSSNYALFQVSGLAIPLALELTLEVHADPIPGKASHRTGFPKPVLLQVDSDLILPESGSRKTVNWLDSKDDDCNCRGIDFNEPNRALDEFKMDIIVRTTDPMVVRSPIDCSVADCAAKDGAGMDNAAADAGPAGSALNRLFRTPVSRDQKIEWDKDPMMAQAVTISHGRILTLRQVWRSDGYSLGDLRYSLPLAPLQKKNIAVIDWDRSDRLQMESTQDYQESLYNRVARERDISEIVNTALKETMHGSSESRGGSSSGGLGFGLGSIFGGASSGSSSAWSSSSQEATRTIAANSLNQLRDQTVQAANALRSQRVTVVQQVNQSESARVVTETVANRNACHAITVQYFEVLRHFRIDHELAAVRECLYIPLPVSQFDLPKALRWAEPIARYLPPELSGAFEACERLAADEYAAAPTYAHEVITSFSGVLEVSLDFPLPPKPLDDKTNWGDYFGLKFSMPSPLPVRFVELQAQTPESRAVFFEQKVAPVLAEKVISSLKFIGVTDQGERPLDFEASLDSQYRPGGRHRVMLTDRGGIGALQITRASLTGIRIETLSPIPDFDSAILQGGELVLTTPHMQSRLAASSADRNSLASTGKATLQLQTRPQETLLRKKEDQALQDRLMRHLRDNTLFYHKAIWWTMDPDRRFAILDGFIAPNAGGRSVASVVENRLSAIIGNCLVMPVAPGIRLDYFQENSREDVQENNDEDWLLARYRPLIPNPTTRVAVPTRGVFAESVMGSCNGCEKMDDSRNWKYWEHPLPDEPTPIETVSLASRDKQTAAVAQPTPMPAATIVNQVTGSIPQAPDPTGLGAAIAAIVNGSAFRDVTGLAGTQQSQRDALTQSYGTTTKFGEMGAELSKKQLEIAGDVVKMVVSAYTGAGIAGGLGGGSASDVKKGIATDAAAGRISGQQARDLTAQVNQHLVDGLGSGGGPRLPDSPEVRQAITRARDEGSPVSVSSGDARVDIGAPTRPPVQVPAARSSSGTNQGRWPFRRQARADGEALREKLPTLRIEIVTAIRDLEEALEIGEKSRQVLVLDCEKRTLSLPRPWTGHTQILFWKLNSVRDKFTASLDDWADGVFSLSALGQTASGVRVFPDIDYRLRFAIDPQRRRIHITGSHDGFPSYTVLVNGDTVYDYEQNLFKEAYTELMGTSDVEVDRVASYRAPL